jgi:hypothetical protein
MAILHVKPPGKWRLDLLGGLGGTVMEIRSRNDSVAVYLPGENAQAVGRIDRFGLLGEIGLPPVGSPPVSLWLMAMPESGWLEGRTISAEQSDGSGCLVRLEGEGGAEHRIWFDPDRGRIYRYDLTWPGGSASARYSNFRRIDGLDRPFRVRIESSGGEKIDLDYRQIVRPEGDEESLFAPRSGPDIRPVDIGAVQWEEQGQ